MNKFFTAIITLFCSLSLAGCQNMTQQDVGTVTGAVAGGLLGSTIGNGGGQLVAIGAGTLAGAYIGGKIGKHMDDEDRARMNKAMENNSAGQPAYWRNAKTGTNYKVTPTKNVKVGNNQYCREYRTTAEIGGKQEQMYGTACRQPDGSWKVVK